MTLPPPANKFRSECCPDASPFLADRHGRIVRYIRLSVTDRCNLRCFYCRNETGGAFIPHEAVLRYEEMEQLVDMAKEQGVEKVRLTGGEPFVRKDFLCFLERLRYRYPDLDIRLTTNGTLLRPYLDALADLKLKAINLSLDTFNPVTFERITGRDLFREVRRNVDTLLEKGIPFKLNAVALRGINTTELPFFLDFALRHPVDVRFIEFMPMGKGTRWTEDNFCSVEALLEAARRLVVLNPLVGEAFNSGPARLYSLTGLAGEPGSGRLGVITPLSNHFCASCNRLRFTSDGALRTCLFADREYRLRNVLRHPKLGIRAVGRIVTLATRNKPLGSRLLEARECAVALRSMSAIGG